jgi:hypothetical protein
VKSSSTGIGSTLPGKCRPLTTGWWPYEASADCRHGRERGGVRKYINGQRIRDGERDDRAEPAGHGSSGC